MRKGVAILSICVVALAVAVAGLTLLGLQPHQQPDHQEFCFAEWCIAPTALASSSSQTVVHVQVRSSAIAATQRPDHPQAWLVDANGRMIGGPQERLNGALGPQQEYTADLAFPVVAGRCTTFVVSEGAWPPFLQLGYAPGPFGERAGWRLCE